MPARLVLLLCTVLAACAGSLRSGRGAQRDEQLGPLLGLVPSGPSWVIQARPRALAEQEAARALWRSLVTEERERAFAERTGVDPLEVEELVAYELPANGYVLLVRGPFDAERVVVRAGERLAVPDVVSDEPLVRREGLAGKGRYAYAQLSERAILVAKDAPPQVVADLLARREALLSGRADAGPKAMLAEPDAHALYTEHAANPFLLLSPRPLALEPGTQVALLFARERALAVTVRPTHAVLPVSIDLRGEFPPGAERNFRALARSLASAQLGQALGLLRVPDVMAVRVDAQGAFVTFAVDVNDLVAGVRMLFFDDMRELLGSRDARHGLRAVRHSATSSGAWRTAVERSRSATERSIRRTVSPRWSRSSPKRSRAAGKTSTCSGSSTRT